MTDQEVGKTAKTRVILVAVVTLLVGCGVGWGIGQLLAQRALFQRTVLDAEAVYGKVNTASERMLEVQRHLNALANAATGNPAMGEDPRVDYDTITALRAIEKPFDATAFTNRNYNALGGDTVNNLFSYVMNIERVWQEIQRLAGETLPENRREALDSSAADSTSGVARFGAVLIRNEDTGMIEANLGFRGLHPQQRRGTAAHPPAQPPRRTGVRAHALRRRRGPGDRHRADVRRLGQQRAQRRRAPRAVERVHPLPQPRQRAQGPGRPDRADAGRAAHLHRDRHHAVRR
ncbi:MAG: hypothetical protein M5U28_38590 [Sandaracinaceae bacterium]|nr:hypothetical protein [Sandaracinaceae bacterium]